MSSSRPGARISSRRTRQAPAWLDQWPRSRRSGLSLPVSALAPARRSNNCCNGVRGAGGSARAAAGAAGTADASSPAPIAIAGVVAVAVAVAGAGAGAGLAAGAGAGFGVRRRRVPKSR
ncbi:hypothetical protein EIM50_07740 [Pseudoxanthomonas sp. SGD-10]|nr:hypothetical protein EIM50_07740 [Pseudoxanthomonas sp. SGD-10]